MHIMRKNNTKNVCKSLQLHKKRREWHYNSLVLTLLNFKELTFEQVVAEELAIILNMTSSLNKSLGHSY